MCHPSPCTAACARTATATSSTMTLTSITSTTETWLALFSPHLLILMIFKLEKKWKLKKQIFKTEKTGSTINGKKSSSKKKKNGFVHLLCVCIYFAFSNCFFLMFCFALFQEKRERSKQKQTKANRKSKTSAKTSRWTNPCFLLFGFAFSPFILLLCFCDFADLLFGVFIFLLFFF